MPEGPYFDEFFNVTDHWNFGAFFKVSKQLSKNYDVGVILSKNKLSKWGQFGNTDVSLKVNNLKYLSVDFMSNYYILTNTTKPFVNLGVGYTYLEEGTYNTIAINQGVDNLVEAMTLNLGLGINFEINDNLSINLASTYKHSFEDYLTKHWLHTFGLKYKFLGNCY